MSEKKFGIAFFGVVVLAAAVCLTISFTDADAQKDKVWELSYAHHMSMSSPLHTKVYVPFKEDVEKLSGGRMKVTLYPGGALAKPQAEYDLCTKGVMDMSQFLPAYTSGVFPLSEVLNLPFAIPNSETGTKVMKEMFNRRLLDQRYYNDKVIYWLGTTSSYQIFLGKKKVTKLEDMKGLKLRVAGGLQKDLLLLLGSTPVSVPGGEFPTALEHGVVNGGLVSFAGGKGYKLDELSKYVLKADVGVEVIGLIINRKSYDGLPADLQKVLDKAAENFLLNQVKSYDVVDLESVELFKKAGVEVLTLTPAEKERWLKTSAPVYENWVNSQEKAGQPGKKVYGEFKKIMAGYGVTLPY